MSFNETGIDLLMRLNTIPKDSSTSSSINHDNLARHQYLKSSQSTQLFLLPQDTSVSGLKISKLPWACYPIKISLRDMYGYSIQDAKEIPIFEPHEYGNVVLFSEICDYCRYTTVANPKLKLKVYIQLVCNANPPSGSKIEYVTNQTCPVYPSSIYFAGSEISKDISQRYQSYF